jgi:TfoX/Sxy family transcriptional regulator of competence genes
MAYDERTAERVRRVLTGRQDVLEKKMMGGVCFMVSGSMCCGVSKSALMVRVGREAYQQTLTQPHVRPLEFAGRRPIGFVLIDPVGYETDTALAAWIQRGIDFTSTIAIKKSAARKPRATRSS